MDECRPLLEVLGRTTEGACAEGKAVLAGLKGLVSRKGGTISLCCKAVGMGCAGRGF